MTGHGPGRSGKLWRGTLRWWLWSLLVLLPYAAGCHRAFYRQQADNQAYSLVFEKADDPRWPLEGYTIQVNPESRMFDAFNPDRPPMPPDDPVSHQLMHCVDDKRGYPHWHANGDVTDVESPFWKSYLMVDENGVLVLDMERSVQLALLHSPEYQNELEDLYLSALDVSAERFQFDVQLFGPNGIHYQTAGRADGRPRSRLQADTLGLRLSPSGIPGPASFRANKAFTTGSELAVGIANSLVWDLSGSTTNFSNTLLDFVFIQPLLRDAGRDRIMETLTRSERTLLANVRQMERFRRGFYVEITTGSDAGPGPNRAGGFFGQSGLGGFTGVGGGGFGGVGGAAGGGGFGGGGTTGAGAAQAGGFIGILQDQQNIRNQQTNIVGLRENLVGLREVLRISETNPPTDAQGNPDPTTAVRNQLQIAQARQALFSAEGQLLNQQNGYQATLDSFKFTLGLPPKTCVKVEDPLLDQFNLISTEIGSLRDRASDLRVMVAAVNSQILDSIERGEVDGRRVERLPWTPELADSLAALRQIVADIELVRQQLLRDALPMVQTEVDKLEQVVPRRQEQLNRLRAKYVQLRDDEQRQRELDCQTRLPADVDPEVTDAKRFAGLVERMRSQLELRHSELQRIEAPLMRIGGTLDQLLAAENRPAPEDLPDLLKGPILIGLQEQLRRLADQALFTSLIQARSRADRIELVDIDLTSQQAFEIARRFRRDWMNQRAGLVDQWRLIEFNADNLEGFANVVAAGDISNQGQNPLKFRGTRGHLRFGLQFAAPYTRLQERNTYRQSLIEYQQARRSYYRYVDQVSQGLRGTIRQVELNQLNFEARRVALLASINQVELTSEIQTLTGERGQAQSPTAARDIVSALGDLRNAQNDFLSVWVNYEVLRRTLDFNLGTMQLDDRGLWIDPGPIGPDHGSNLPYADDACPDFFLAPFLSSPLVDESAEALPWAEEVLPPGQSEELAPAQPADAPPAAGRTLPLPAAPTERAPAAPLPLGPAPTDEPPLLPERPAAPPLGPVPGERPAEPLEPAELPLGGEPAEGPLLHGSLRSAPAAQPAPAVQPAAAAVAVNPAESLSLSNEASVSHRRQALRRSANAEPQLLNEPEPSDRNLPAPAGLDPASTGSLPMGRGAASVLRFRR